MPASLLISSPHRILTRGEVHDAELLLRRKDGSTIDVTLNVSAVRDEQGNVLYSRSILRDITSHKRIERLEVERRFLRTERLAELGQVIASVAHEINNPLGCVTANLDFIARRMVRVLPGDRGDANSGLGAALSDATKAAERIRSIVRDLSLFSRPDEADQREPVDLRRVLESAVHEPFFTTAVAEQIVFMTGGAVSVRSRDFVQAVPNTCLQRPFDLRVVRELLRTRRQVFARDHGSPVRGE